MRALWLTNVPIPILGEPNSGPLRGTGGWMAALIPELIRRNLELAVCTAYPGQKSLQHHVGPFHSYIIPQGSKRRIFCYPPPTERNSDAVLRACRDIISEWKPDVVHCHGTERVFGLLSARHHLAVPMLISIQGLLDPYSTWQNTFGPNHFPRVFSWHSPLQFLRGQGPLWDWLSCRQQAKRERAILAHNRYFAGRTDWDRAHLHFMNASARYIHVGEALRPAFFSGSWDLGHASRHSIFFTNARGPRRNVESLVRALALLSPQWPGVRLRLGGMDAYSDGYSRWIQRLARCLGVLNRIDLLGRLTEEQVARELRHAHVFVLPSRIENSPNSLCEAQCVGTPVVAAAVGGVQSLVDHGRTGLLYPSDDDVSLAACIGRVFSDDALAVRIAQQATLVARQRHSPSSVADALMDAYACIIADRQQEGDRA